MGTGNLVINNLDVSRYRAFQETLASGTSVTIGLQTDTLLLTGTSSVSKILSSSEGRRLKIISVNGGVEIIHNSSMLMEQDEFWLKGESNITLGQYEILNFEGFDLGAGKVLWVMA